MKENNDSLEGTVKYGEYEKQILFPNNYDDLLDKILQLFHIPEEKKSFLIISFKNYSGDSIKIFSSEEYSYFLTKLYENEISNIIYVSLQQSIKNKILPFREDISDKDEDEEEVNEKDNNLKQGHIFSKNKKHQSNIFGGGEFDINKMLNENNDGESKENNINNINNENNFNNEIIKSVLSPVASFPSYCNMCQKFPIKRVMYYCNDCKLNLCEDCEKYLGYNHRHCYYIIRNKNQYQEIINMEIEKDDMKINNKIEKDINNKEKMEQSSEKKEGLNGIFSSLLGFIKGSNNYNNNNNKNENNNNINN